MAFILVCCCLCLARVLVLMCVHSGVWFAAVAVAVSCTAAGWIYLFKDLEAAMRGYLAHKGVDDQFIEELCHYVHDKVGMHASQSTFPLHCWHTVRALPYQRRVCTCLGWAWVEVEVDPSTKKAFCVILAHCV